MKQTITKTVHPDKPAKSFNDWARYIHGHFRTPSPIIQAEMREELEGAKQRLFNKFLKP